MKNGRRVKGVRNRVRRRTVWRRFQTPCPRPSRDSSDPEDLRVLCLMRWHERRLFGAAVKRNDTVDECTSAERASDGSDRLSVAGRVWSWS